MKIRSAEHWQRIDALFGMALPLQPHERAACLDASCSTDPGLRAEVERLLAASDEAGHFLESLDVTRAAELLEPPLEVAEAIGRYRVIRRLGSGGMGVVYLAEDESLRREIAVKLLPPWLGANPAAKQRLIEEARAASAIDHPNVATVHEIGETDDGRVFITMSYYEGDTLRSRLARGPLTVPEATDFALQTARGLAAAHRKGIVHRDIKPENVLVRLDGTVKLVDFGIAEVGEHATHRATTVIGTAAYMSPEQTLATRVDARTDLWSLGVVLYEMLAGERPFGGRTRDEISTSIRIDPPRMNRQFEQVPTSLRAVVRRCLQKDPATRYQFADELARDLQLVLEEIGRIRGGWSNRTWRFVRHQPAAVVAAVLGTALVAGALVSSVRSPSARIEPSPSHVAILPFTPAEPDTLLQRLGRVLAATVSGNLDGTGDLRSLDISALSAQLREVGSTPSTGVLSGLGLGIGASFVISGSLTRVGTRVRAEGVLVGTSSDVPLARVSATGAADDLAILGDSLAYALLHELWRVRGLAGLDGSALTTRSFPALRAYFEGDRLANEYRMRAAATAFARAIAVDSTFWFAYWRYAWANAFHQLPVDRAITETYLAHRFQFPAPDRLLIEARGTADLTTRLGRLESLVRQFPDYWPGWFELGETGVQQAPFAGRPLAEAQQPLRRAVSLNPAFVPAWDRLLWIAIVQRDTIASGAALRALERLHYDSTSLLDEGFDMLLLYRHLHHLSRSLGVPDSSMASRLATGLTRTGYRPSVAGMPDRLQSGIARYGFHAARIDLAERQLRLDLIPPWFQWHVIAYSLATRGAWDSAFVAADRGVRGAPNPASGLFAYRLAVVGAWLGAVEPLIAAAWRGRTTATYDRLSMDERAELAWVDGLLAFVRQDAEALMRAGNELRRFGVPAVGPLGRSLTALAKHIAGDRPGALELMASQEEDRFHVSNAHPFLAGVNRITASRWLLAAGDTARSARLLMWHEAITNAGPFATHANALLAPFAYLERGRMLEAQGNGDAAQAHYAQFLDSYDLPTAAHRRLVADVRASLSRAGRR